MPRALKVLLVEDSVDDALLTLRWLARAGFEVESRRVDAAEGLTAALEEVRWDLVLTDVVVPDFGGLEALAIVHRHDPETPVVVVSGAVGEEQAAALMRAGARDFVHKRNLSRLGPVVERELGEAEVRRERRRAQEALARSEARHRGLLESLPVGVYRAARGGSILSANPALLAMLGYESEAQLAAVPWREHPVDVEAALQVALESRSGIAERELEVRRRDGSTFWALVRVRGTCGPDGQIEYVDGTLLDRTRQRALETALKHGKEEWERTFDAVRELIVITDPLLNVIRVNQAVAERLQASPRDVVPRYWGDLIGERLPPVNLQRLLEARRRGGSIDYDYESELLGGQFRFSATPRLDEKGVVVGAVHVGRDVTIQRQIEELLRRQTAVDQAEHIFRTFRHEVGNALNTLKTALSVLRESHTRFGPEQRESYLTRCLESLRIAETLLAALRTYQTLDHTELRRLDVAALLREKADLLFGTARSRGIACVLTVPDDGPVGILVDPDALVRVLLNLLDNAIAATAGRDGGRIELSCRTQAGSTLVEVADNGSGVPVADLPHVFSPLFTRKPDGTGMGLAIVQKLMLRMNGVAHLSSEPGQGTVVELRFPQPWPAAPERPPG